MTVLDAAPVRMLQHEDELHRLLDLYRERQPLRVLEIGTDAGGTLYHWLRNATWGALVVAVDDHHWNERLYDGWCPPEVTVVPVHGRSNNTAVAADVGAFGPFDWVFIDADHTYQAVTDDWNTYRPMCAKDAVVCFHDILGPTRKHPEIQVSRLWHELQRQGYPTREIVSDPTADWGGLGVAYL